MRNFFEHQEQARRGTSRLLVVFLLLVLLVIILVYAAIAGAMVYADQRQHPGRVTVSFWQPTLLLAVTLGTGALIGGASAYKVSQLSSGGKSVALMLGGQEIQPGTSDWREKRLLNIVEEMAIASGVPVPPVFLLNDETGINAFAAGYAPGDAVVAVSRGCMDYLTRDEIQGVVAHEFSHILNGDMRLNVRLLGWIHGLLFLSIIGYYLIEIGLRSGSSRDGKNSGLALAGLGLVAWVAGGIGSIMGQFLQAAVSRQREFLADASAVQFTRNPDGIGGALKKIGGISQGSLIRNPEARSVNHMFFGEALRRFTGLLASHPPLDARIRAIDPQWNGEFPPVKPLTRPEAPTEPTPPRTRKGGPIPGVPTLPGTDAVPIPVLGLAEEAVTRVGTLTQQAVEDAATLTQRIPEQLREASHDAFTARLIVFGLLLDADPAVRAHQQESLDGVLTPPELTQLRRLDPALQSLEDGLRVPLLEIALPSLRQMSRPQYQLFRQTIQALIEADGKLSLFEFVTSSLVQYYLDQAFEGRGRPTMRFNDLRQVLSAVRVLLSRVAYEGAEGDLAAAQRAFASGVGALPTAATEILPERECELTHLEPNLRRLRGTSAPLKQMILGAVSACILADQVVTTREYELLRVICAQLDCPMPPQFAVPA